MKKGFLIAALVLFIGAAFSGAYAYERYTSHLESFQVSEEQYEKSGAAAAVGNDDQALRFMDYSTDNLRLSNEAKFSAWLGAAGVLVLVIAGIVVIRKGKEQM